MSTIFKVCNCNRTMPLDAESGARLGDALGTEAIPVASQLCRRDAGAFMKAIEGVDDVVVACTQERALFEEIARQRNTAAPVRFVNIRETAGWSSRAKDALPKMAALLAAAALPEPEPVPSVAYESSGHVLLIGPAGRVLPWAQRLGERLEVTALITGADGTPMPHARAFPVFSGEDIQVAGWLGEFKVRWRQSNPIDLEMCTRCNACIEACPEQAIDWSYQVDLSKCVGHRDCVKACGQIGAIDFSRNITDRGGEYDLIFDLSDKPIIGLHQPPQGYFAGGGDEARQAQQALRLAGMVGEFEKPKFFLYREKLCAHGRNGKTGCELCIEVCSAAAISHDGNHVKVAPHLCVGCGACGTVCPSGALGYAYPRAPETGLRIKTMLKTYSQSKGQQPALLFHSRERGAALIEEIGRTAKTLKTCKGVPARVIPVDVQHTASVGIDLWLAAIAYGAANVLILLTDEEAPQYSAALDKQAAIAGSILSGLGYRGRHVSLIRAATAAELDAALAALEPAQTCAQHAAFNVVSEKRGTLEFAIEHLLRHAPQPVGEIELPAGSLYGSIEIDKQACTLCMSCVGACPSSALLDNPELPQLKFIERNCVQCGLCEKTCPENAIALHARLLLTGAARQPRILNEAQPCHCIRCGKAFGTLQMIESMIGKLSLHSAFAGNLERLRMCADCRVVDMMETKSGPSVLDWQNRH